MSTQSATRAFATSHHVPGSIRIGAGFVAVGGSLEIMSNLVSSHRAFGSIGFWIILTTAVSICLFHGQRWALTVLWLVSFLGLVISAGEVAVGGTPMIFGVAAFLLEVAAIVACRQAASRGYFHVRYPKKS